MFTGIIQDIGNIKKIKKGLYTVLTRLNLNNCKEGSSIACNGVCLTAKNIKKNNNGTYSFDVNLGEETLKRSNLEMCVLNNEKINIEKSLTIGDEIGGHFVYGHIDAITSLIDIKRLEKSWEFHFKKDFGVNNKFIKEKASIAINGISLTIAEIKNNLFIISIIDHTYKNTNIQFLHKGNYVNIEFDYLARFILSNDKL
tara:strand:+ start:212 stop:808 length:597 start_codon:yes stop_codon:yes gene_type:complete